ncbi:Maturation and nuclear export of 40S ribosomal subunits interacting protein [Polyrhizophydium stewartii]|uniref:Maturation and nuclear export of 40S ribosomal subunits interacting protein n=1 Tax=Polyrhizophydium stewartii TaxID=2732419 RepID=A0ABR4NCW6_9FUNG|nr:hypothetical protein HK105_007387 [Polyrhizophydium stewartii]
MPPKTKKHTPESVRQIAKDCLASSANLNGIVTLLDIAESGAPEVAHAAIASLHHVFSKLVASGALDVKRADGESNAKIAEWLRENRSHFLVLLRKTMVGPDHKLQITSFEKHIAVIKDATEHLNEFQNNLFIPLVELILSSEQISSALESKIENMLNQHDDLRFFFFRNAAKAMSGKSIRRKQTAAQDGAPKVQVNVRGFHSLLSKLRPAPDKPESMTMLCACSFTGVSDEKSTSLNRAAAYRRAFSECWLEFLRNPLPREIYRAILETMHQALIPRLSEPVLLMDFLVDAYNTGGIVSLLALNGLFTLIHEHNLDYPDFYHKLYALFDTSLLHYKYRARFFRLAELFLSSAYLPAYLVSAFIKRMARLCLFAPPTGIVMILPFIFNLLKKHPSSIRLIHSPGDNLEQIEDPFDFTQLDPSKCRANESFLWEILALKMHVIPAVSGLARIFEDSLAKPPYDLEDFMDHTFKTMVTAEVSSKKRKAIEEDPPAVNSKVNKAWLDGSLWVEA